MERKVLASAIFTIGLIFFSALAAAQSLDFTVKKEALQNVIVKEIGNSASYKFEITNNGDDDYFRIYSLLSVSIEPSEQFLIKHGETKEVVAEVRPSKALLDRNEGNFVFEYQVKGINTEIWRDFLQLKIVPLKQALEFVVDDISKTDTQATVRVRNKVDVPIEGVRVHFNSVFFSGEKEVSVGPKGEVVLHFPIKSSKLESVVFGPYLVQIDISYGESKSSLDGVVNYVASQNVKTIGWKEGTFVKKVVIEKHNIGNTPARVVVRARKNALVQLFTTLSPQPTYAQKNGFSTTYIWDEVLAPGEKLQVVVTTNYVFPILIIFLLVIIAAALTAYFRKSVTLTKSVSFVKTKKGEFALKVSLQVKARSTVEKVQIIDTIPAMAKLYEKYGKKPDRIDHKTRRLYWNIDKLVAGEERIYSYIIYSKLGVVGKFELPPASAVYERDDKIEEVQSNKVFFIAEKEA
ncbi:hypothetical protein D6817_03125 [Candidatus Pacearchaeota archaeon]|nr:MAG: hypothetical protein D6817_03125 [Candidatus Pacearchaeota archaeon]